MTEHAWKKMQVEIAVDGDDGESAVEMQVESS
jgi:hypothetical protein